MTLDRTEMRKRDELLARAVAERKVVAGSKLYHTLSDTFAIRPRVAEAMVEQLTPAPEGLVAAAGQTTGRTAPAADGYDAQWLTGTERQQIARAQAGYDSVSHTFE